MSGEFAANLVRHMLDPFHVLAPSRANSMTKRESVDRSDLYLICISDRDEISTVFPYLRTVLEKTREIIGGAADFFLEVAQLPNLFFQIISASFSESPLLASTRHRSRSASGFSNLFVRGWLLVRCRRRSTRWMMEN